MGRGAGAGTAAFARQLRRRRLTVVELDISEAMLRHDRAERPMAVVSDVTALPLRDGCVDLTVGGFVLSHLDDAGRGLSELVRVTKPGGTVLATAFPRWFRTGGRYWDRTSDLLGVNEALSR